MWLFGKFTDEGSKEAPPSNCRIYPTMMKLGTVIPYLKKTHNRQLVTSSDTQLVFS